MKRYEKQSSVAFSLPKPRPTSQTSHTRSPWPWKSLASLWSRTWQWLWDPGCRLKRKPRFARSNYTVRPTGQPTRPFGRRKNTPVCFGRNKKSQVPYSWIFWEKKKGVGSLSKTLMPCSAFFSTFLSKGKMGRNEEMPSCYDSLSKNGLRKKHQ